MVCCVYRPLTSTIALSAVHELIRNDQQSTVRGQATVFHLVSSLMPINSVATMHGSDVSGVGWIAYKFCYRLASVTAMDYVCHIRDSGHWIICAHIV